MSKTDKIEAAGYPRAAAKERTIAPQDAPRHEQVDVGRARTLRYLKAGSGPPLILMHTLRGQLEYFREAIPALSHSYTVYAIDLPGHGHSSIDRTAPYDEPYFREAVVAFIEKLDLRDVTLAGESIGGVLALTVAAALPARVKRVVSSNPYDYETRYADGVRRGNLIANLILACLSIPVVGTIFAALENPLLLALILRGGFSDGRKLPRDLVREFDRVGRRRGYRYVQRKTFAGWKSWADARAHYTRVNAPVTLVYGECDWSRADERARTRALLKPSEFVVLLDTGHFAFLERPTALIDLLLK